MNALIEKPLILGFVAPSGTGKTTLLEKIIRELSDKGHRIAVIKHAHHDFDIDIPGKDSFRLRKAGAQQTMVCSKQRWALINEITDERDEPNLLESISQLDISRLDIIIVEGFKHEAFPKIVLHRKETLKPVLPDDQYIIAYVTNDKQAINTEKPVIDLNKPSEITNFIENLLNNSN